MANVNVNESIYIAHQQAAPPLMRCAISASVEFGCGQGPEDCSRRTDQQLQSQAAVRVESETWYVQ